MRAGAGRDGQARPEEEQGQRERGVPPAAPATASDGSVVLAPTAAEEAEAEQRGGQDGPEEDEEQDRHRRGTLSARSEARGHRPSHAQRSAPASLIVYGLTRTTA